MRKVIIYLLIIASLTQLSSCNQIGKRVITNHQSTGTGGLSVTNEKFIFYIQNDGIYQANMDMSDCHKIIETDGVTKISVYEDTLVYSKKNACKDNVYYWILTSLKR